MITKNLEENCLELDSGRKIYIQEDEKEDTLEVREANNKITFKIRFTESGPIMVVEGMDLQIKAQNVKIQAKQNISLESENTIQVLSKEQMSIKSEQDVKVVGKKIYLN
jgi:ribosomal protein S4E